MPSHAIFQGAYGAMTSLNRRNIGPSPMLSRADPASCGSRGSEGMLVSAANRYGRTATTTKSPTRTARHPIARKVGPSFVREREARAIFPPPNVSTLVLPTLIRPDEQALHATAGEARTTTRWPSRARLRPSLGLPGLSKAPPTCGVAFSIQRRH